MGDVRVPPWMAATQACGVLVPLIVSDVSGCASQHSSTAIIRSLVQRWKNPGTSALTANFEGFSYRSESINDLWDILTHEPSLVIS